MGTISLSPRESLVLRYSAWGFSNKAISERLRISIKTVEAHKTNGMRKLRLPGRVALIRYAVATGWLALELAPSPENEPAIGFS